jgi:hypothetical protein
MQNDNQDIRALDAQELDAISGGTAWEGAKAVVREVGRAIAIGAGFIVVPAQVVLQTAGKQ